MIKIINADSPEMERLWQRHPSGREDAAAAVAEILAAVAREGDAAVCRYTKAFDGATLTPESLAVTPVETVAAVTRADESFLDALDLAAENIIAYHRRQLVNSWCEPDGRGMLLGQLVRPLNRVGIYVPGGTAAYPSSVLMNALPARVAGVKEIVMATPPGKDGRINPYTLAAAARAGVTEIYKMGGAQAIAALAYGTATIRPVDKIAGPGNLYVTLAKKQVYGLVDIDMLAGPSEVLIIAGADADPRYIAADMLAQAEHDPLAAAVLLTPDRSLAGKVQAELAAQLERLSRRETAARALEGQGAIVITADLEEAITLANRYAPEHLELAVDDPFSLLGRITAAGAVFLGAYAPEPLGDYLAGPSHVLPTGGTARFYSPLGVDAFLKRTSVISCSRELLQELGPAIIGLARVEGLDAHAAAIQVRLAAEEKQPGAIPAGEATGIKAGRLNGQITGAAGTEAGQLNAYQTDATGTVASGRPDGMQAGTPDVEQPVAAGRQTAAPGNVSRETGPPAGKETLAVADIPGSAAPREAMQPPAGPPPAPERRNGSGRRKPGNGNGDLPGMFNSSQPFRRGERHD